LTQDIKVTDTAKNKFKTNIKEYLKTIQLRFLVIQT
jgi:hypothetical protein